ncbi:MAG: hypothetical protein HYT31_03290 [Parcubacteria group bacterium]|nr:hypothetical protein [Parcubacteria group bacterium]
MKRHITSFSIASLNEKFLSAVIAAAFLIVGGVWGYSIALFEFSEEAVNRALATTVPVTRVLGTGAGPYYQNPFEAVDAKTAPFPIAQLAGCRNWEECAGYCEQSENYQACVAWSKSLE